MLVPGLQKFTEPYKTFVFQQLSLSGIPFAEVLQYFVKFSQIGVGSVLIFLAYKGNTLNKSLKNKLFYLGNFAIITMMLVATYVHLHPNVPAHIVPIKPPVIPISYIVLVSINLYLNSKQAINN
ncbi:hypothetical protein BZG02_06815 [Labilibaculum filiforme]|uniref:Uncharacterized protein n=1 Tax=Labilibaculum filiforme TaxID=1940526 RepID=A0A2N3I2M0_9BACT|nr:hypothetical protein BZG02_06815 [Labilibaculum filiforme]